MKLLKRTQETSYAMWGFQFGFVESLIIKSFLLQSELVASFTLNFQMGIAFWMGRNARLALD